MLSIKREKKKRVNPILISEGSEIKATLFDVGCLLSYSNKYLGGDISNENHRIAKPEINSLVINGKLNVELNYSNVADREYDILALKRSYYNVLFHI